MHVNVRLKAVLAVLAFVSPVWAAGRETDAVSKDKSILYKTPRNIRSLDLIYGAGGPEHMPRAPFKFHKEDLKASSPKYDVLDAAGVKWKVKLGQEAQPETAASRFVWAVGYQTAEEYYLPLIHVAGVPATVHRGLAFIDSDGTMHGARFKREPDGAEKAGEWKWKANPFTGTRELNGLRTLMSLLNNWDVKDENNAVYREDGTAVYQVSDLGATFGSPGFAYPDRLSKGDLEQYQHSRFICGVNKREVDFCSPGRSALWRLFVIPEFIYRWRLRWIGRDIPRADARWIGEQLARLSPAQVRDAFRAAGYPPETIEAFARVVEHRIGELNEL